MRVYSSTRTAAIIIGLPIYLILYHYDVKRYKIFFRLFTEGKPSVNNFCSASLARLSCFACCALAQLSLTLVLARRPYRTGRRMRNPTLVDWTYGLVLFRSATVQSEALWYQLLPRRTRTKILRDPLWSVFVPNG